ncbi:MAG: DUF2782 domain-containing protein [Gammaproteobacteria bacterium]|jgi:hypothetical protein
MSSSVVPQAAVLFFCSIGMAMAATEGGASAPDQSASSVPQQPEITIIQRGKERVEEYRVNNQIYMVKITPAMGYPYYLVDTTGDGNFDTRRPQLNTPPVVPQWVLFRWK